MLRVAFLADLVLAISVPSVLRDGHSRRESERRL
jgi:hypothetical protein